MLMCLWFEETKHWEVAYKRYSSVEGEIEKWNACMFILAMITSTFDNNSLFEPIPNFPLLWGQCTWALKEREGS
jgi:hypothetical protein